MTIFYSVYNITMYNIIQLYWHTFGKKNKNETDIVYLLQNNIAIIFALHGRLLYEYIIIIYNLNDEGINLK